jgi:hypothetical protein
VKFMYALVFTASFMTQSAAAVSPTWADYIKDATEPVYRVTQFLQTTEGAGIVTINGGKLNGLVTGTLLEAYRIAKSPDSESTEPLWIKTGALKIMQLQDKTSIAHVVEDQTELSKTFFPKFPNLMAGDLVLYKAVSLTRKQSILPQVSIAFNDLFIDPKARPLTFELRPEAIAMLKEQTKQFAESRAPLLMIEGYTDQNGNHSENQVESYQRAMTIRQYLIDELGFDQNRVVAIGYGESELNDTSMTPGFTAVNRRIVIKALSQND